MIKKKKHKKHKFNKSVALPSRNIKACMQDFLFTVSTQIFLGNSTFTSSIYGHISICDRSASSSFFVLQYSCLVTLGSNSGA